MDAEPDNEAAANFRIVTIPLLKIAVKTARLEE